MESYKVAGKKPESLAEHSVSKHWVLKGMTPEDFSDLHAGTQFDFSNLLNNIEKIMPDILTAMNKGESKYSIEFASLVLFTIGPASRDVKEGQREKTWAVTIPEQDGSAVNTIFISTYRSKAPAIMQPVIKDRKICLTIKQASLIALHVTSKIVPMISSPTKILLTPLAGAIFCKTDLVKVTTETGMGLSEVINMINESAQSGGFYLPNSTCAAAAVCAIVATKHAETKIAVAIVTKTIKQYFTHKKEMDWVLFDILSKYATGGVPSGMSRDELLNRLTENQKLHMAKIMREAKKMDVETQPSNMSFGQGPSGGGGPSAFGTMPKADNLEVTSKN